MVIKELKMYNIILKKEFRYTRCNEPLEVTEKTRPEYIVTLPIGTILWTQDKSFTIEQIMEAKEKGFHYQFGFGHAYEKISIDHLHFVKLEIFDI